MCKLYTNSKIQHIKSFAFSILSHESATKQLTIHYEQTCMHIDCILNQNSSYTIFSLLIALIVVHII